MNNIRVPRLPSLAHPIIVNPSQGVEIDEESLFLPPFSEINLNWPGCTVSHLHWVAVQATLEGLSGRKRRANREIKRVGLALLHEYCHRDLAHLPFSLLKKYEMFIFYSMILEAIEEKRESIEVPLNSETPRSPLEKQWALVVDLKRESELVEEVYAIRSSLVNSDLTPCRRNLRF